MQPRPSKKVNDEKLKVPSDGKSESNMDKWIHICAWVLLTVGLCILATTFYLAIRQHNDEDYDDGLAKEIAAEPLRPPPPDVEFDVGLQLNRSLRNEVMDLNKEEIDADEPAPAFVHNHTIRGCEENSCRVACMQADDIYLAIYRAMAFSKCASSDILVIQNQQFPLGVLKNSWINLDHGVHEVVLYRNNLTKIKNAAFNSPLFAHTFFLSIYHFSYVVKLDSGALLGLRALKYLQIDSKIGNLDRALFQPVQTTLAYLKLNAKLEIAGNRRIAGISKLSVLEFLDLSFNRFVGALSRNTFSGMPNLKYLTITNSRVRAIETDAFSELAGKLYSLNLSNNNLKSISIDAIVPLLKGNSQFQLNLAMNDWYCTCMIQPLSQLYSQSRSRFMEPIFCRAPHPYFGKFIDDIAIQQLVCSEWSPSDKDNYQKTTTVPPEGSLPGFVESEETSLSSDEDNNVFRMRCLSVLDGITFVAVATKMTAGQSMNVDTFAVPDTMELSAATSDDSQDPQDMEMFQFDRPSHSFELELLANNSVMVFIEDYSDQPTAASINIIWFSEALELYDFTYADHSIDYSCMGYDNPYLLVESLEENTTYTFCLIPRDNHTITPFNCLPLHVPIAPEAESHVWISQDDKRFTIGMLCMIFFISSVFGAVIAYFGIKSHPDLLEGSKNVLVVKKSDRTCYVSTIGDAECLKEKPPLSHANSLKYATTTAKNDSMPTHQAPPPPSPIAVNVKQLERLASMKSTTTCFEEPPFIIPILMAEDEYELPKTFDAQYAEQNAYARSPCLPPPLPKRNSCVSDTITVVPNRFGGNN